MKKVEDPYIIISKLAHDFKQYLDSVFHQAKLARRARSQGRRAVRQGWGNWIVEQEPDHVHVIYNIPGPIPHNLNEIATDNSLLRGFLLDD